MGTKWLELLKQIGPGVRRAAIIPAVMAGTVPIVAHAGDPLASGLVASLARPGGNLTGRTFFLAELCAKRVELIKEAMPTLTRLAVLLNPANPSAAIAIADMQRTASALGMELECAPRSGQGYAAVLTVCRA